MPRGRPPLDKPGDVAVSVRNVDSATSIALTDLARFKKVSQAVILERAMHDYVYAQSAAGDPVATRIKSLWYEGKSPSRSLEELNAMLDRHRAENIELRQR